MSNRRKSRREHDAWTAAARVVQAELRAAGIDSPHKAAPVAVADQLDAAHSEGVARLDRARRSGRFPIGAWVPAGATTMPPLMGDRVFGIYLSLVAGIDDGSVECCPHISLESPVAAIADPARNRIACYACGPRHLPPPLDEVEDHTCDVCRGYVPGQTIHPILPQVGPLLLVLGACDDCLGSTLTNAGGAS